MFIRRKENNLLKNLIEQMKIEMKNRKEMIDADIQSLKLLVHEPIEDDIISYKERKDQEYAENCIHDLNQVIPKYEPTDETDALDYAVTEVKKIFKKLIHKRY